VVSQHNADIADTLQLREAAMANFRLSIHGVHIGATWQIRLDLPCAAAMRRCQITSITCYRSCAWRAFVQTNWSSDWESICDWQTEPTPPAVPPPSRGGRPLPPRPPADQVLNVYRLFTWSY